MNSSEVTDRTLVLRAQSGERAAFGELVTRYMQRAYYTALGLVGNHDDALDLSQEAFARAFRARATIDAERPFFPWLYQIIRRLCFNHTRDQRSRRQKLEKAGSWLADTTMGAQPLSPEKAVERAELRDRVAAAIERLAEREREALVLREFEGLRYREIAELLGIPIGTVMSRLYRARRSLAREIETAWARPVRREARDDG
ncbi:RNA polymerase sigma factor [Candidatus Palauibacter sp.]|uniref:RNA polymerase sigma factor n=1 Tax=Candidatus Palauibacter sp. TaxID=3101350 RepID=UPI003B01ED6A